MSIYGILDFGQYTPRHLLLFSAFSLFFEGHLRRAKTQLSSCRKIQTLHSRRLDYMSLKNRLPWSCKPSAPDDRVRNPERECEDISGQSVEQILHRARARLATE
jgi:hypothetical protein